MTETTCIHGDDSLIVADYLAGRLSRAKARTFEAHCFGCDRCFRELQFAMEMRAAASPSARSIPSLKRAIVTSRPFWPLAGLAAAVAVALGIWVAQPLPRSVEAPRDPVYRDSAAESDANLALEVAKGGNSVELSWPSVQRAERYTVRIWNEAGDPVFQQETHVPSLKISAARLPEVTGQQRFYVQVVAVDELQQPIVRSGLVPL